MHVRTQTMQNKHGHKTFKTDMQALLPLPWQPSRSGEEQLLEEIFSKHAGDDARMDAVELKAFLTDMAMKGEPASLSLAVPPFPTKENTPVFN